jgi:ferredoxin
MVVINPDECIDCGVCEPECPIEAIKPDAEALTELIELNREYAAKWPKITEKKDPLETADEFKEKSNKLEEDFSPKSAS